MGRSDGQRACVIAHELVRQMRALATVDWHHKRSTRAQMRRLVKHILKRCGYPPELEQDAVQTVLAQAEVMLREASVNEPEYQ